VTQEGDNLAKCLLLFGVILNETNDVSVSFWHGSGVLC